MNCSYKKARQQKRACCPRDRAGMIVLGRWLPLDKEMRIHRKRSAKFSASAGMKLAPAAARAPHPSRSAGRKLGHLPLAICSVLAHGVRRSDRASRTRPNGLTHAWYFAVLRTTLTLALLQVVPWLTAVSQTPRPAATAPSLRADFGYSFMNSTSASGPNFHLNGVVSGLDADLRPHLGIRAEIGYVRAARVNGSTHHGDVLSLMAGPVFTPTRNPSRSICLYLLAGSARTTGAVPAGTGYLTGYAIEPAWAAGIGTIRSLAGRYAIQTSVEYLHTTFFDRNASLQGQSSIRVKLAFVYSLREGRPR